MQIEINGKATDTKVLFSADALQNRIKLVAAQINKDYGTEETLIILVVLHGALLFAADLVRNLQMPTEIESVRIKSYHGTRSTGRIQLLSQLPESLRGQHVLVVEDIVDSGRSIAFLQEQLKQLSPKSVKICTLLNKPEAHELPVTCDYVGFDIGKNFVIGYGLDLDGKYRNLSYVAEVLNS